jgi:hypothetical protein
MKSLKIFTLLFVVSTTTFAQLKVNPNGESLIGNPWPGNDYNNEMSIEAFGLNTISYRPNARMSFGDYGAAANGGANVFLGEQGNGDSDALQLHGKNGIYFTQGGGGWYTTAQMTNGNFAVYGYVYGTAFVPNSDIRLKKNVKKFTTALPLILKMQAITYDFKTEKEDSIIITLSRNTGTTEKEKKANDDFKKQLDKKKENSANQIGFSAQDVRLLLPQVVKEDETGYLGINYSAIVPVLVEAMKEQQAIIEAQKAEIDSMKKDIDLIKKKVGL